MLSYKYRCSSDGDFQVESTMRDTTRMAHCPECDGLAPKVLGGHLQFTYGKEAFHDGFDGNGSTIRESARRQQDEAKAAGLEIESSYRHV